MLTFAVFHNLADLKLYSTFMQRVYNAHGASIYKVYQASPSA
ncbi:MAG: hypothetical protein NVS4B9_42610 [Ktedonobacteraceae bacterium]